ncbi:MAG: hypothetical protein UT02_C0002G0034 [Parcubacteria group bacterium GW2011_GWC2_38_7]|nr:MAG: hypothetical protein UT02_C0002G0034 [Parcubacteria group bacterium GW2011_GWC2_38_7]
MPFEEFPKVTADKKCEHGNVGFCGFCATKDMPKCKHGNIGLCGFCLEEQSKTLPPLSAEEREEEAEANECEHGKNRSLCEICNAELEQELE